jgi:hypothetical protein
MNPASDGPDAVAQAVIDGLLRRAAARSGPARQLLVARAGRLRALQGPVQPAVQPHQTGTPGTPGALGALTALVDRLGRTASRPAAGAAFQDTWVRLRTQQRLRQALAQVPEQAGPLHSAHLVHRTLQALSTLSPAYLDAMLSHVDALLWLDQANGPDVVQPAAADKVNASQRGSDLRRRRTRTRT